MIVSSKGETVTQIIIVAVYLVAVVLIGIFSRRKNWKLEDYLVAGRKGSTLFITGSLLATIIGASATLGMAGLGSTRGLTGAWWLLSGSIGLIVLGLFFARRVREFGLFTLPSMIEKQYNGRVALAASLLIVFAWIGVIAGQIVAFGKIMSILGIGSQVFWMIVCTIIFVGYTILGGQYAVIRTDLLQLCIIFVGIFASLAVILYQAGGIEGLKNSLGADYFAFPVSSKFGAKDLLTMLLLVGLTYVVGPDMYSRLFCAKDTRTARKAVFWSALLLIPFTFAITLIGMGAFVLRNDIPGGELVFPAVIQASFPPFIGGLIIAALLSAIMSSADTTLLSASTILVTNVVSKIKRNLSDGAILILTRYALIIVGIGALLLALELRNIIGALMFAYTIFTGGVILPVIAGYYRKKLRVTSNAALAAIIGGGMAALASKLWHITYLDIGALGISLLLMVIVSVIENQIAKSPA